MSRGPAELQLVCIALLVVAAAACTVGPDYQEPQTRVPEAFAGAASAEPPPAQWWTSFADPTLNALVDRAVASNPDLRLAQARVREARALRGIAAADGLPTIDATGAFSRRRTSANTIDTGPGSDLGQTRNLYQVGFDAMWELDVFGGIARSVEAADAELAVSVEGRRDALVSLLAEVARNYIELRGAQRQATIARSNVDAQRETLDITRLRFDAGLASDLDVARAEAQMQTTAARIPELESAARQSIHALGVLLGQEPNALVSELAPDAPIPPAPPTVPVGLPSDLLRRRPDVRRAERQLAAATARIGVATADLFPSFSLTGSLGREASRAGDLGDPDSRVWSIGPNLRWPLLDWGRVRNDIEVQGTREEQAFIAYEQVVLTSLREVEDALVAFSREQERRTALAGAVASNQRAVERADELYKNGSTDFLNVLQAQRDLFSSEQDFVESDQRVSSGLVALYKALGGGWELQADSLAEHVPPRGEAGQRSLDLSDAP